MIQYIVILLDDTSVSFCHYSVDRHEHRLIPLQTLRAGILYAMKENLNVQFVYPDYELPAEYQEAIDSVDHSDIKPKGKDCVDADVVVLDGLEQAKQCSLCHDKPYVLRITKDCLLSQASQVASLLGHVARLNVIITDARSFTDADADRYSAALQVLADETKRLLLTGVSVQLNLLTDRMALDDMNNCGAGDTTITLAPDGHFYVCPAFYQCAQQNSIGSSVGYDIGDLESGLNIKNAQLYRIDHAPICRHCDAYQCRRCIWLNRLITCEVNTPSHEQCVMAHLERNASQVLLKAMRQHGTFLPEHGDISEISYLDPFDMRSEWDREES